MQIFGNPNLLDAIRMAIRAGCEVFIARRTGEYVISHPIAGRCRINSRRKDCPRVLVCLLRRLPEIG